MNHLPMTETVRQILNHRTYREFDPNPLDTDVLQALKEVASRTATSNSMQWASIVRVTDPSIRETFVAVGDQDYVGRAPELWVFLADARRNAEIVEEKTKQRPRIGMDAFLQGFSDAILMAQNVMTAIESYGMGGAFLGNILNDAPRIREALSLPDLVFPVVGIIFGKPSQAPEQKPRMPMEVRFFENSYEIYPDMVERLADYDEVMRTYYDLRHANQRTDAFTNQVVRKLESHRSKREKIIEQIGDAGFITNWEADDAVDPQ